MYKRKYKKGKQITSIEQLIRCEFIYLDNKIYSSGWWKSWQLNYIIGKICGGHLYEAEQIERVKR